MGKPDPALDAFGTSLDQQPRHLMVILKRIAGQAVEQVGQEDLLDIGGLRPDAPLEGGEDLVVAGITGGDEG